MTTNNNISEKTFTELLERKIKEIQDKISKIEKKINGNITIIKNLTEEKKEYEKKLEQLKSLKNNGNQNNEQITLIEEEIKQLEEIIKKINKQLEEEIKEKDIIKQEKKDNPKFVKNLEKEKEKYEEIIKKLKWQKRNTLNPYTKHEAGNTVSAENFLISITQKINETEEKLEEINQKISESKREKTRLINLREKYLKTLEYLNKQKRNIDLQKPIQDLDEPFNGKKKILSISRLNDTIIGLFDTKTQEKKITIIHCMQNLTKHEEMKQLVESKLRKIDKEIKESLKDGTYKSKKQQLEQKRKEYLQVIKISENKIKELNKIINKENKKIQNLNLYNGIIIGNQETIVNIKIKLYYIQKLKKQIKKDNQSRSR